MPIASWDEAHTPPHVRRQILALQDSAWPGDENSRQDELRLTHDPALNPVTMALIESGLVVAALDILSKQLTHADQIWRAGGLSTVVTRWDKRGRGHALQPVRAACTRMQEQELDLAIFTCDVDLAGLYERAGFLRLNDTVLVGGTPCAPFPSDQVGFVKVTLARFYSARAQHHSRAFVQARIELFPGEIDRLW